MRQVFAFAFGVLGTAVVMGGVAVARQDSKPVSSRNSAVVKLEWVTSVPKRTESLTFRVSFDEDAVVASDGRMVRSKVEVGLTEGSYKLHLDMQSSRTEQFKSIVWINEGETLLLQGKASKSGRDARESLVFVTVEPHGK